MREATTRIVIEGNVLEALALENVPIMGGDVYPAVVEVLCVYKGPRDGRKNNYRWIWNMIALQLRII